MAVTRMGPRLNLAEQMTRNPLYRGRLLARESHTPRGNILRAAEIAGKSLDKIATLAVRVDELRGAGFIPEMVQVPAGTFEMGSAEFKNAQPIRQVRISAFAIGRYKVTGEEYKTYLEATGQAVSGSAADPEKAGHPAAYVNWNDTIKYIGWLKEISGRKFRLPTEAEGEYAFRGFSKVIDISGNIWEWRSDWYADGYDPQDLADPKGPQEGTHRVLRGGLWLYGYGDRHLRNKDLPTYRDPLVSFRLAEDK